MLVLEESPAELMFSSLGSRSTMGFTDPTSFSERGTGAGSTVTYSPSAPRLLYCPGDTRAVAGPILMGVSTNTMDSAQGQMGIDFSMLILDPRLVLVVRVDSPLLPLLDRSSLLWARDLGGRTPIRISSMDCDEFIMLSCSTFYPNSLGYQCCAVRERANQLTEGDKTKQDKLLTVLFQVEQISIFNYQCTLTITRNESCLIWTPLTCSSASRTCRRAQWISGACRKQGSSV